jgi:hypothetical protein
MYAYHDAKVRLRAIMEMDWPGVLAQNDLIDQIAFSARRRHSTLEQEKLKWLSREFIFNERLFLWNDGEVSSPRASGYQFIYELANLSEMSFKELSHVIWDAVRNVNFEEEHDSEDVYQILNRIETFIQYFGYKHFFEEVTQYGGQWGPSSGIGSREAINLVPRQRPGICHRIVLGTASGLNGRSRRSLLNILDEIVEHLQRCGSGSTIAIVISDAWDNDLMIRYVNAISSYRRQGKKFLFLLVNGRKLVPLELV